MDVYEATRIVFSRIQNLDPENASKIMGLLLIQDHGEKEMIRLAFGPENLVHSLILKARKDLGISRQNSLSSSPSSRLGLNLPPPFSPRNLSSAAPPPWTAAAALAAEAQNPDEQIGSALSPSSLPFYGSSAGATEMADEFQLSFLDDNLSSSSPTAAAYCGAGWGGEVHRRSCSVSDVCLGADDLNSGFGWKPCLYFARGYCKNGTACRFLHGETAAMVGSDCAGGGSSPSKMDMADLQCHDLLRSKSAFPYYSSKTMNFLLQQNESQRLAANLLRSQRSDFSVNPASRQIYLTFPADSTFREEDVSNYFSIYGPVQDVRIPYQQKRMFGFVTFVYPETVKLILAKGNPHFVCDARVLVKPYKEKGKVPDKYRKERPDFSPSATAAGLDYDVQLGPRMFYDGSQDMVYRRKLEERADLQQALELQSRRLMGLQLLDVKKHHHHHSALSNGSPIPSPTHSPSLFSQTLVLPPFHSTPEENCSSPVPAVSVTCADQQTSLKEFSGAEKNGNGKGSPHHEILEHNLPDSPFASPKASREYFSAFSNATSEAEKDATVSAFSSANNNLVTAASLLPGNPTLDMASFKSFNCQMPRFSGAIGMYAGTGGPTCPVGI